MKNEPIVNLPIVHPATSLSLPDVTMTIEGYETNEPSLKLELDYRGISYTSRQPKTAKYDKLLAKAINKQAMLIGWWLSKLNQLDVHPTAPFNISRNFKIVIGPWSYTLRSELTRLNFTCYSVGKVNGKNSLIQLGE